jgi:hypothetical protein
MTSLLLERKREKHGNSNEIIRHNTRIRNSNIIIQKGEGRKYFHKAQMVMEASERGLLWCKHVDEKLSYGN